MPNISEAIDVIIVLTCLAAIAGAIAGFISWYTEGED